VEVVAETDLEKTSAAICATFESTQLAQLPINGRNWRGLMTLTPGAIDTGAGNGASIRFFAQGGDDVNYRVDGVDATAVRNQAESKSRMMISEDAIAEWLAPKLLPVRVIAPFDNDTTGRVHRTPSIRRPHWHTLDGHPR
jgi:hypothetical protein